MRDQASEHARAAQRSVQKQIEYWSRSGRILERHLNAPELYELLSGRGVIADIRLAANEASGTPDVDTVLAELAADRASGALHTSVTAADTVYDLADDGQSLRRRDASGRVATGRLVDGRFIEDDATT